MSPRPLLHALHRRPWLLSIGLALFFLPFKLHGFRLAYLNIHAARDWERGWQLFQGEKIWLHGPELLLGGSVPGFFFYLLTGLTQFPVRMPELAAAVPPLLFCLSIAFFHDAMRRLFLPSAALLAAFAYGCFPFGTIVLRYLWNPSYLFFFGALALWFLVRSFREERPALAGWAFLPLLLAGQIHLTMYFVAGALVAVLAVRRWFPGWRVIALVLAIQGVFLGPYYAQQFLGGWTDHVGLKANARADRVEIARLAPNPNFVPVLGLQLVTQAPSERLWPQTFPFSYYDLAYRRDGLVRAAGWLSFFLTASLLPLLVLGAVRRGGEPARRAVINYALLALLFVSLPHLFWNPRLGDDPNVGVPARYFFAAWPCQFVLLAAGLDLLLRRPRWRTPLAGLVLAAGLSGLLLTTLFTLHAARTGNPFRYLKYDHWPVHTLRDKMAVARYLVAEYGLTEELFQRRVHTGGDLLVIPEESLDYEIRAAIETVRPRGEPDDSLYYFLFDAAGREHLAGEWDQVDLRIFGAFGLLVYRPHHDLSGWKTDPPVSWWL